MRYSDQELLTLACSPPDVEGRLWYRQQRRRRESYRERLFRLKSNFLFYFRIHETSRTLDPLGALLLERCTIREEPMDHGRYVFSLEYQEERDHKHYFAVSSSGEYRRWIDAIKTSSYERLKSTFLLLQREIVRVKDVKKHKDASPKPVRRAPPRPSHPPAGRSHVKLTKETTEIPQVKKEMEVGGALVDIT
ncbi:pleckstrin homology domain-containing family J member 1-like [Lytechinus variegatus]|uniref:pleckstrin homology domain-containing family J member 1-like n=1 Tax=Lytechinus variegatus TaxID=7654 RepID=UPI001BB0EB35|nr:pleckstrin homology domain-containing family J member 1-like [Lytechinus variegatus]XP_041476159.1 pleckstrin homology domain-containing family J member 1-like [Lytechinus variegatus]